jgi:hypothetical protein
MAPACAGVTKRRLLSEWESRRSMTAGNDSIA